MEEKDYKEIAKIIKKRYLKRHIDADIEDLIDDLADYFEKTSGYNFMPHKKVFNRKQFLKDCGVA